MALGCTCRNCKGSKIINNQVCPVCKGEGRELLPDIIIESNIKSNYERKED